MTATIFRQRIMKKNAIPVFIQSKKIFSVLERWAEEKWIQLSFSSALPCRITRATTAAAGRQPSHPTSCLAAILIPLTQLGAPTREILVEAQISDPLAFQFSLPDKRLLVVLKGNFEPAEKGTWLPKDFLGYADLSGFSLVPTDFLWTLFQFLFSCEFLCEEKLNLSVDAWFWSCLDWYCMAVRLDLEFYFIYWKHKRMSGLCSLAQTNLCFLAAAAPPVERGHSQYESVVNELLVPGDAFAARRENRGYRWEQ